MACQILIILLLGAGGSLLESGFAKGFLKDYNSLSLMGCFLSGKRPLNFTI